MLDTIKSKTQGYHKSNYSERAASLHKALLDTTVRNSDWCEFWKLSPSLCPSYIAFLKDYMTTLDRSTQVAYYHFLKGISQEKTSIYLQLSQDQVESLLSNTFENLPGFFEEVRGQYNEDDKVLQDFYKLLLNDNIPDGEIAELYQEEVAAIKIIRIFAKETVNDCKKNCNKCAANPHACAI